MKEYYTIDDIIKLFPRCTTFMVRNYRYKTKIGLQIDGVVYYTADEVTKFIEDVEFENIARRTVLYEYIKHHPGVKEKDLYKYLPYPKQTIANLLVDISTIDYVKQYPGLYEEDDGGLFVEGFERIPESKQCTKTEGIFFSVKKRRRSNGKNVQKK
jgi:hypothetical protein